MSKIKPPIISKTTKNKEESESDTTWVFKSLMEVVSTGSKNNKAKDTKTVNKNNTDSKRATVSTTASDGTNLQSSSNPNRSTVKPSNTTSQSRTSTPQIVSTHNNSDKNSKSRNSTSKNSSGNLISYEKMVFPSFPPFDATTPTPKRTRLPSPSELFSTETNPNYFNNTEEELLKEMEESATKQQEQSLLYQLFKSLEEFDRKEAHVQAKYTVDSFSNVSGLLEKLSICLVSDKIQNTFYYDKFGIANRSFFKNYQRLYKQNAYKFLCFNEFSLNAKPENRTMHSLLTLLNEIPTKSTFYFKHTKLSLATYPEDSASVKKAVVFSRFFKNISAKQPASKFPLISNAQFNFFKTISSSIEMSLIGNSLCSIVHNCKYDETLPLKSFPEEPTFFMKLPNLLFLIFNSVLDNTFEMSNFINWNKVIQYSTRTLVFNFIALGNISLDAFQLSNLRLAEQRSTSYLNRLASMDSREMHSFFERLELSKTLVSKVQNLVQDTSTFGTFVNPIFLKLKQLNRDIFVMKQSLSLISSSEITASKLSAQVRRQRWSVRLLNYNSFFKTAFSNLIVQNTIQNCPGIVSSLEILDQLKDELELMVIRMIKNITRIEKKINHKEIALSSFNFTNLFSRRRKKYYFLKFHKKKKNLKATFNNRPNNVVYDLLKKKVSRTSSMYTTLQNTNSSSFFYSLCLERSRLLSKFRNHLIKKGFKLKATNYFLEILSFIKNTYRLCPVKVLRFLLLRHYKATLVTELFIKKRKIFVSKQLSLRKQMYYMVFSFLKEASLRSNSRNFSYKKNKHKKSRFLFSIENYIESLMHTFMDGTSSYLLEKNKLVEVKLYNTRHYLVPSNKNRSRLRNKFSLYAGH